MEFEQRRLHDEERRPDPTTRVEWIAGTRGDGAGYDIASFNPDASPRLSCQARRSCVLAGPGTSQHLRFQ